MTERRITIPSLRNCRDLGSLKAADGRTVKMNHLLRSAMLNDAEEKALLTLNKEHRLVEVFDLRSDGELERTPDVKVEGITITHTPIIRTFETGVTHEKSPEETIKSVVSDLMNSYEQILTDEVKVNNLGIAINAIMTHDYDKGSVMWHCSEGKDRCGIVSMLILLALGVDYETTLEDYLVTNETNKPRADNFYQSLLAHGEKEEVARYAYDIFLAKKEYLDIAYAQVAKYDDIHEFFQDKLNITREIIDSFRNKVLE